MSKASSPKDRDGVYEKWKNCKVRARKILGWIFYRVHDMMQVTINIKTGVTCNDKNLQFV